MNETENHVCEFTYYFIDEVGNYTFITVFDLPQWLCLKKAMQLYPNVPPQNFIPWPLTSEN